MKIGIIGAMEEEIQLLKNDLEIISEETIGMRKYYTGKLFGRDIVLVFSRWGKVAAASTVTTLIQKFQVDLVLFTGVAGAVNSKLNIGDIVISKKLIQHDMDVTALPGFKKFEIPLLGKCFFEVNSSLLKAGIKSANHYINNEMKNDVSVELLSEFRIKSPKVVVGTIASGDQFISDKSKIQNLSWEIDELECIEMEGAAVAQVCYEHGVNFMVFRVISDKADEHANMDFNKFIKKAASYFTKGILKQVITSLD
ncbi:MAG TPA: 5'-methylthioadenosine/adenosylhomocysteine nucleosidase [Clostridium sp.]